MKTPLKKRIGQAKYKLSHWPHVRRYQKIYMRTYRKVRPDVIKAANARYTRRHKHQLAMYYTLINLAKADRMYKKTTNFAHRKQEHLWLKTLFIKAKSKTVLVKKA